MDITTLSQSLASYLLPFLPHLVKVGENAAQEVGKKVGGEMWGKVVAIWDKLRPKVDAYPAAKEAIQDAAAHPDDSDVLSALRLQLRKILAEDERFAQELRQLLEGSQQAASSVTVDKGSVYIGGHAQSSTIITGDSGKADIPKRASSRRQGQSGSRKSARRGRRK